MEFELGSKTDAVATRTESRPFNVLVLGDFSAHAAPDQARRVVQVDLDTLDQLWSLFSPSLSIQGDSGVIEFTPASLDDFHPDQLYLKLPIFDELSRTRDRLLDPATADEALGNLLKTPASPATEEAEAQQPDDEDAEAMFGRLLGKSGRAKTPSPATPDSQARLDSFIRNLVAPHIVQEPDPKAGTAVQSIDEVIARLMRELLHQPAFQELESSWRSLHNLVTELELDESLRLYVCNIRKQDLLAALPDPGESLQESALFRLLVEQRRQAADDTPWTLITSDYFFGPEPEDVALLTALGAAAAVNGGIFLGGARPEVLGCSSSAELADASYWATNEGTTLWQSLRASPVAGHIGLALPRVLARLPYGAETEEIDAFAFEEMPQRAHEHYLWANPSWDCARLLAQSFTREGWRMAPGDHVDLGPLPAHHFREDGESKLQPCAEILLSESTMVAMLQQGLMPLVSYRNQNTAVLGRFQSIAEPLQALAGPWARE
jgi:type VI secretion system protein ImpC